MSVSALLLWGECWTWRLLVKLLNEIYSLQNNEGTILLGLMTGLVRCEATSCYKVRGSSDHWGWSSVSVWQDLEQHDSSHGLHLRHGPRGVSTALPGITDDLQEPRHGIISIWLDRRLLSVLAGPGPLSTIRTIPVIASPSQTSERLRLLQIVSGRDL